MDNFLSAQTEEEQASWEKFGLYFGYLRSREILRNLVLLPLREREILCVCVCLKQVVIFA